MQKLNANGITKGALFNALKGVKIFNFSHVKILRVSLS